MNNTNIMFKVEDLQVYYGSIAAIKGISLEVSKGEIVTILGANGAGKTTTLRTISRLHDPKAGKIYFKGQDITRTPSHKIVSMGIGHSPEGRRIFNILTVEENLLLGAYVNKETDQKILSWVYELFPRLQERRKQLAGTLSGGEQQMLAIARALMARPRLLLLDEPSMGLAPMVVEKILEVISLLRSRGLTIVLVEQNALAALEVSDRGYVFETGAVVLQGGAGELLADKDVKRAYLGKDYGDFYDAG